MNIYVTSAIAGLKEKLNAHVALMNYRYINLCVKAELGSLLPVTVSAVGKELNIEDVAQIATPNEYQLDVYPKLNDYQQPIIEGIFDVHPEFKLEILQVESSDDKRDKHLLYTMPDVDKERYDLLNNMAKVFRDECNVDIDKECALHTASLPELTGKLTPEDIDEIKEVLEHTIGEFHDKTQELYEAKIGQIEEAYMRYLEKGAEVVESSNEMDFSKGMRFDQMDS